MLSPAILVDYHKSRAEDLVLGILALRHILLQDPGQVKLVHVGGVLGPSSGGVKLLWLEVSVPRRRPMNGPDLARLFGLAPRSPHSRG